MCVLRASGAEFDPESFLQGSPLEAAHVFRAGEPRLAWKPEGPKNRTSGFTVDVNDGPWNDLQRQIADACAFLDSHAAEIQRLRAWPGVQDVRLDFPVESRISMSVLAQFEFFPPAIVERAGRLGLGLEISIYACEE